MKVKSLDEKLKNYPPLDTLFNIEERTVGEKIANILRFKRKEFDQLEEVVEVVKERDKKIYEKSYFTPFKVSGAKNLEFVLKEEYKGELDEEEINLDIENRKKRIKGGFALYESSLGITNILKLFYKNENLMIVKLGIDPTKDLHLGHLSVLLKAKTLQELGAPVIIILGDYTATVGDPSGGIHRSEVPQLEKARQISIDYIKKILNILDNEKTFFIYNSDFHLPDNRVYDLVKVVEKFDLAELLKKPIFLGDISLSQEQLNQIYYEITNSNISNNDFQNKINFLINQEVYKKLKQPTSRILYPSLQALDSILTGTLIELGGTDQRENLLLTRELQRAYGLEDEALIYEPLIIGKDGKKMSKSLNNFISLNTPEEVFLGIFGFPDFIETEVLKTEIEELRGLRKTGKKLVFFPEYINLCIKKELCEEDKNPILILECKDSEDKNEFYNKMLRNYNPLELKIKASEYICKMLFGEEGVKIGYDFYLKNIKKQELPENIIRINFEQYKNNRFIDVISEYTGISKSEIRRISEQNGIKIIKNKQNIKDSYQITSSDIILNLEDFIKKYQQYKIEGEYFLLIGKKHFIKIGE